MHNRLRELRRARNLTLAQVAQRLGTTPQTVSRMENEVITLSTDWLERFGTLFGVEPAEVLGSPPSRQTAHMGQLDRFGQIARPNETRMDLGLPAGHAVAITLGTAIGPYGAGDILVANRLTGDDIANAIGHDALCGTADGAILLRRLLNGRDGQFVLAPLTSGEDVSYAADLDWAGRILMRISYF